jgi:hypothetical protein
LALAAGAFAGCDTASFGTASAASDLESIIEDQLPRQLRRATGSEGFVKSVSCVDTGEGNRFDCQAKVALFGFAGGGGSESIPITGYCDDRNCTWRTN